MPCCHIALQSCEILLCGGLWWQDSILYPSCRSNHYFGTYTMLFFKKDGFGKSHYEYLFTAGTSHRIVRTMRALVGKEGRGEASQIANRRRTCLTSHLRDLILSLQLRTKPIEKDKEGNASMTGITQNWVQYYQVKWQLIKGEPIGWEKLLGEQDSILHANSFVWGESCCKGDNFEVTRPVCSTTVYCIPFLCLHSHIASVVFQPLVLYLIPLSDLALKFDL